MLKKLFVLSLFVVALLYSMMFIWAVSASAAPFITSDPQEGTDKHYLYVDGSLDYTVWPALEDGAAYIDMAVFAPGWHTGSVYSCEEAIVIDNTTTIETSLTTCSDFAAPVQFKVPHNAKPTGFMIRE